MLECLAAFDPFVAILGEVQHGYLWPLILLLFIVVSDGHDDKSKSVQGVDEGRVSDEKQNLNN